MFSALFVILFSALAALFLIGMILLKTEKTIVPKYYGRETDKNDEDQVK